MKLSLPATMSRVPERTKHEYNEKISRQTEANIQYYKKAGRHAVQQRLKELHEEWDIERTLETNATILSLMGLLLATTFSRKWLILTATVNGFLLQHALQGWCPPVPLFRRFGIRTQSEIERERYGLRHILEEGA